jgi:hypothetical protein
MSYRNLRGNQNVPAGGGKELRRAVQTGGLEAAARRKANDQAVGGT